MARRNYQAYLRSAHWQRVKDRYYKTHKYKCTHCRCRKNLHLHHLTYKRIGCERMTDLIYLCARCHAAEHGRLRRHKKKWNWKVKLILFAVLVWWILQMWGYGE